MQLLPSLLLIYASLKPVLGCYSDYDCAAIKGAQCYDNQPQKICDCPANFVMNVNGNECLPIARQANDRCDESSQCILGLFAADCVDNQCKCRRNYHFSSVFRRCIRNKVEGDLCRKEDDNCYQLGPDGKNILRCLNGLCMNLKLDTRPHRVSISRVCHDDDDCAHIRGSKCTKSKKQHRSSAKSCKCPGDQVIGSSRAECLPVLRDVGLECQDSAQCSAGMFAAECVDRKCRCWREHRYHDKIEKCIRVRAYGDPCSEEVDGCYQLAPDGSNALECVGDSVCRCRPYFKLVEDKCLLAEV